MREVPGSLDALWKSGRFIGENKPTARVTLQVPRMGLAHTPRNRYASIVFGSTNLPVELPNVRSVSWDRDVDQDVAGGSIEFFNATNLLPDRGYYTPNRGDSAYHARWGLEGNEWQGLLVPDMVLRTYEGYGTDGSECPCHDTKLYQSGTWLIDEVEFTSHGIIRCTVRDLGRVLLDQLMMPPVVPDAFLPLAFDAVPKTSGFHPPTVVTQNFEEDWDGPTDPPTVTGGSAGDSTVTLTWDPPPPVAPAESLPPEYAGGANYEVPTLGYFTHFAASDKWYRVTGPGQKAGVEYLYGDPTVTDDENIIGPITDTIVNFFGGPGGIERYTPRYEVVGYRLYRNGVVQGYYLTDEDTTVTVKHVGNGRVSYWELAAVWQELNTGRREVGLRTPAVWYQPSKPGSIKTDLFSLVADENNGVPADGWLTWTYEGDGAAATWHILLYRAGENGVVYEQPFTSSAAPGTVATFDTGRTDLTNWNILIYAENAAGVGQGVFLLREDAPGYLLGTPVVSSPPQEAPPAAGRAAFTTPEGETVPVNEGPLSATLAATSDTVWIQPDTKRPHPASNVLDGNRETYWQSLGVDPNTAAEWIELAIPTQMVTAVRVSPKFSGYKVWVSVMVDGVWQAWDAGEDIPYDPARPITHNGANIPFVEQAVLNDGEREYVIRLRQPVAAVDRVRFTFSNPVKDAGNVWRMYIREIGVLGEAGASERRVPTPTAQKTSDDTGSTLKNAHVTTGAGDHPGTYEDYTDIVKLLCAWGGFHWSDNARSYCCDGSSTEHSFGLAPYGLGPKFDPILGLNSGRVWGDFEESGVAGVVKLGAETWDKKPLMEGIAYVRDILGFLFHVDEEGGVVWRAPNIYTVGNYILNRAQKPQHTTQVPVIDEQQTLIDLSATLTSRNLREHILVAAPDGSAGAYVGGSIPNYIGLRRVAGWTDRNFASDEECQLMADMIALRQLFTYRTDSVTIPGYPKLQINDQVRIYEQVTGEVYLHYIKGISSSLNVETGEWTYTLSTHWLGERPFDRWAFDPANLSEATRKWLKARGVRTETRVFEDVPTKVTVAPEPGP